MEPNLTDFLKISDYCDHNSTEIKEQALIIVGGFETDEEKAVALFNWVRDNIKYRVGLWQEKASKTLKDKEGTCTNKANLLVAMLRSIGIPAGYGILKTKGQEYFGEIIPSILKRRIGKVSSHIYAFVFLNGNWIKCDPSLDTELSLKTSHFNHQSKLVIWDGKNDAMEELDPDHIIHDHGLFHDIDEIMRKKSKNGTGYMIQVANLYIDFLRIADIKDLNYVGQIEKKFLSWMAQNHPFYLSAFFVSSIRKEIKSIISKNV